MHLKQLVIGCCAVIPVLVSANLALAQAKPDDAIKARQATFAVVAAHVGRIKSNLDGDYKKEDVMRSAAVIQAIANAGLTSFFPQGTDKGIGFHETQVKPELFDPANAKKVTEVVNNFNEQANQLVVVANVGDKAAVQTQFGKLRGTCKGCHDSFRIDSTAAAPAPAAK
jgi:cytochrome c556